MKIFYAIQGTGNGHISRAEQLYPYLQKHGEVDFFLSGSNAQCSFIQRQKSRYYFIGRQCRSNKIWNLVSCKKLKKNYYCFNKSYISIERNKINKINILKY